MEEPGGLVGELQERGPAQRAQLRLDLLGELPDLAALRLAERRALPGAGARQVVLLGAQVLGEDHLLPLAVEESRGVRQARLCCGVCPQAGQLLAVDDGGASAAGLFGDTVGEPVDVEDLDLAAHVAGVHQKSELGVQRLGQVPGESRQQNGPSRLPRQQLPAGHAGQVRGTMQRGHGLAGSSAASHLRRACVTGRVSDLPLRRMQEDPPGSERVLQDPLELVIAVDEDHAV